jgi:uncharacterized RDD family membrane protein YckC
MKTNTLFLKTPEGIVFSQTLAGPVSRFLAWFIDFLVIVVVITTLGRFIALIGYLNNNIATTIYTLSYFGLSIGYGIFLEWAWRGQTLGKRLFHLRVVDAEGMRMQFDQIMTRNLLRFVDLLPAFYFVGGLACLLNRKCQRLGDIAANTVVVRSPAIEEPDLDQLLAGKFNSLRQYPYLAARLRQTVSPSEAAAAIQAIVRRSEFEPAARVELFEQLAAHFRAKVAFPPEATDGLSDEQYVRNVVDVVTVTSPQERLSRG